MIRLNLVVEGPTELGFFNSVLKLHLAKRNIFACARCIVTKRDVRRGRSYRGGISKYSRLKDDLSRWIRQDNGTDTYYTTMIDLYGLPDDFPGRRAAELPADPQQRVEWLERKFFEDIGYRRFIPYIQLYEFESLLLSNPQQLDRLFVNRHKEIDNLIRMVSEFDSPELINDGAGTAPSKRIISEIPEYEQQKSLAGPVIAEAIGLGTLREKCRHFSVWISKLERLVGES